MEGRTIFMAKKKENVTEEIKVQVLHSILNEDNIAEIISMEYDKEN